MAPDCVLLCSYSASGAALLQLPAVCNSIGGRGGRGANRRPAAVRRRPSASYGNAAWLDARWAAAASPAGRRRRSGLLPLPYYVDETGRRAEPSIDGGRPSCV